MKQLEKMNFIYNWNSRSWRHIVMQDYFVNLVIGIIGGIYSGVIVSRMFLIREEYQEQIEILRKSFYYLGGITAFFEVVEIILKNMLDTSVELKKNADYIKNHNLKDGDSIIEALKNEILNKNIEKICANEFTLVLKEKELAELQHKTSETVKKFKYIEDFKFETIDNCKKEINSLKETFEQCFKRRTKTFFALVIKDKILIVLFGILILICFLAILV